MTEKELLASLSAKANEENKAANAENENISTHNSIENNNNSSGETHEETIVLNEPAPSTMSEANTTTSHNTSSETVSDAEINALKEEGKALDEAYENASEQEFENKNSSIEESFANKESLEEKDNSLGEASSGDFSDVINLSEEMRADNNLPNVKETSEIAENSTPTEESIVEEEPMTLLDHMKELRKRLTRVVVLVLIGFFACYPFSETAYHYLSLPLQINLPEGSSLIYTSPAGAFFVYLKISLVLSFFASSPFSFYQIWAFVAPGLYKEEKRMLMPLAFFSAFFFLSGAAFCYFLVFPIAFEFFMGFATEAIVPMISIEEYLSFVLKLLVAFGLVFEMPLFAFFLARMGILTTDRMKKWRKYAILMMFIIAAILTPPDVFSQTLMACPMIVLYEISVLIVGMVQKQKAKEKAEKEENEENEEESPNEKQEDKQDEQA